MAFFGLTQLGYQDTIREHVNDAGVTPQHIFRSGKYRELPQLKPTTDTTSDKTQTTDGCRDKPVLTAGYAGNDVSYHDLKRRIELQKYKHDPATVYRRPVVTSGEIGKWTEDEPLAEKEPWTYVRRHPLISSEMTRFVNQMGLTNKEFFLF